MWSPSFKKCVLTCRRNVEHPKRLSVAGRALLLLDPSAGLTGLGNFALGVARSNIDPRYLRQLLSELVLGRKPWSIVHRVTAKLKGLALRPASKRVSAARASCAAALLLDRSHRFRAVNHVRSRAALFAAIPRRPGNSPRSRCRLGRRRATDERRNRRACAPGIRRQLFRAARRNRRGRFH